MRSAWSRVENPIDRQVIRLSEEVLGRNGRGFFISAAGAQASAPGPAELAAGPAFTGYPCSPTTDDNGLPTWLIVDGKQAQRREKQGDGSYEQVLRIPKGAQAPPVRGV
jgi:hypothetical protein